MRSAAFPRPHGTRPRKHYAERVLDILETYAPGLRAKILGRSIWSPLDLERENPCLIGGDNLTGSHHLDQNFIFRPVAGYSRYATPIPRLYLCGAGTWPGAGTGRRVGLYAGENAGAIRRRDEDTMRIVCIGGGPAGLYFGLLMKKLRPEH